MANAVATADRIIDLLDEEARHNIKLVSGAEEEVRSIVLKLQTIKNMLDSAENFRLMNKRINNWLSRIEQTIRDMDGVLDEWNNAIYKIRISLAAPHNKKVCSFIPSSSCLRFKKVVVHHDIVNKLLSKKTQLDGILEGADDPSPFSLSTSLIDSREVQRMDKDRDILVSKLMDYDDSPEESGIVILSIVGVGGSGKTTLAQLVCNHSRVKDSFELRIWIYVSDPFDLSAILISILESIEGNCPNTNQLNVLSERVRNSILGKKFLLLLDDIWTQDYDKWKPLENILRCGGAGSTILVTTRFEKIAKMMGSRDDEIYFLGLHLDEDSWVLLSRISLLGSNEVEFLEIGKKIANKNNDLPLAVKSLVSRLHFKSILKSEIVDIFSYLVFSFNELLPTFKRCFSYCAVFPKGSEIVVEDLIYNWMALGYFGLNVDDIELKGRECFNALVDSFLLQDLGEGDYDGIHRRCKMPDAIHDITQFLWNNGMSEETKKNKSTTCQACNRLLVSTVNEFSTLYWDEETPPNLCKCLGRLRVLSLTNCGLQSIPQGMGELNQLRYLNLIGITKISHEDLKTIFQLYDLHALSLRKCGLIGIPRKIGSLIRLRRLDLSCNESLRELPREIGNLIQLRHLNLSQNKCLKELPREIGNLVQLRRLDLSWNGSLKELPSEIGNLVHLRRLDLSRNGSLKELPSDIGNLMFLRHLSLIGNNALEELPDSICNLRELQTLNILGCKRICRLPEGVAELIGLCTLGEFRGGSDCNKFGLLKNLNNLGGVLWLRIRLDGDLSEIVDDARAAELSNKTHIDEFRMYFEESDSESESSSVSLNVIDVLQPHSNLKKLSIWNYGGSRLPTWLLSSQVRNLNLHFCKHLTSLPALGKLPCLEELCIDLMEALGTVGREFLGGDVIAFPKLRTLEFRDCGEWKEWEDITVEEEESAATSVMPYLTKLTVTGCNGLTVLPHRLLHKASSMEELHIFGSKELVQRYENEDGSDWESISRNNRRLQLICYT